MGRVRTTKTREGAGVDRWLDVLGLVVVSKSNIKYIYYLEMHQKIKNDKNQRWTVGSIDSIFVNQPNRTVL
jgi:arginine repressor